MKNIFKYSMLCAILAITIAACSKEKRIEKNLVGTWNITEVVTITTDNQGNTNQDTDNPGVTTTFNKGGTGTASSSGSGTNPFPSDFTWSNTDVKLTIIDTQNSQTLIFDILEYSKKEMKLNRNYTDVVSGDTIDQTITMNKNK